MEHPLEAVVLAVSGDSHHLHDLLPAADRPARHPARDDLRVGGEVGDDSRPLLGAARRPAEPGDHLVDDHHDAVAPGELAYPGEVAGLEEDGRPARARALEDDPRNVVVLREGPLQEIEVVVGDHDDALPRPRRAPGRGRHVERRGETGHQLVEPAVEVAREAHDLRASGVGPRDPAREPGRLASRVDEAHPLRARHEALDGLRPLHLERMVIAEVHAGGGGLPHRLEDRGMGVAEEDRAVADEVVDVAVAVRVPLVGAFGPFDVERERGGVADVVAEAARDARAGPVVPGLRARAVGEMVRIEGSHERSLRDERDPQYTNPRGACGERSGWARRAGIAAPAILPPQPSGGGR